MARREELERLLAGALEGDPDAVRAFVEQLGPGLRARVRRTMANDPAGGGHLARDVDDVVQQTFLALFAIYFLLMRRAWRVMRFLKRSLDRRHLPDRRQCDDPHYTGVERRRGVDRRVGP